MKTTVENSAQRKLKYRILSSYLISEEKKRELIQELPNFSNKQRGALADALSEFERKAYVLIQAGLQAGNGPVFLFKLQGLCKKLRRDTVATIEKSANEQDLASINIQALL